MKLTKIHKCKDCDKEISYKAKRCRSCAVKECYKNGKLNTKGKNNARYVSGISLKKHFCKDCKKEIWRGSTKCKSCAATIHGKGYGKYSKHFNKKLKENIRQRDYNLCQLCGKLEEDELLFNGIKLAVHHIDYNKQNCEKTNLISLCQSCHSKTNKNRKYWKNKFKSLIRRLYAITID